MYLPAAPHVLAANVAQPGSETATGGSLKISQMAPSRGWTTSKRPIAPKFFCSSTRTKKIRVDETMLPKPYYQDDYCTIYYGDCRELVPRLPPEFTATDPPDNQHMRYDNFKDNLPLDEYYKMLRTARRCEQEQGVDNPGAGAKGFAQSSSRVSALHPKEPDWECQCPRFYPFLPKNG